MGLFKTWITWIIKIAVFTLSFWSALAADTSVRLYGGSSNKEGFVQVNVAGVWKAICNDSWDALDALVTCRELGFTEGYAMFWQGSSSGYPNITVEGNNFDCNGDEESLLSCKYTEDKTYCSTRASVACGITESKYNELLAENHPYYYGSPTCDVITSNGNSDGRVLSTMRRSYDHITMTGGICDIDERAAMLICADQGYINGGKVSKVPTLENLPMLVGKLTCEFDSYLGSCEFQYTSKGVCPDGIQTNGVQCYATLAPSVKGVLVFLVLASFLIIFTGACGVRWIRRDRHTFSCCRWMKFV